jgi:hypothetical protein
MLSLRLKFECSVAKLTALICCHYCMVAFSKQPCIRLIEEELLRVGNSLSMYVHLELGFVYMKFTSAVFAFLAWTIYLLQLRFISYIGCSSSTLSHGQ